MSVNDPMTKGLSRRDALLVGVAATAAACSSDPMTPPVNANDVVGDQPGADVTGNDVTGNDAPATPDAGPDAPATPDAGPDAPATPDARPTPRPTRPTRPACSTPRRTPRPTLRRSCPPAGAMRLGALTDFPMGSWRGVSAARVIVGRDARGLFAYSSVCTHAGCTVPAPASAASGSECPCHGSQYNADGMNTRGPTKRPLDNYRVVVCGGDVYLQMSMVVPIGTRTAV
jgi:cytochrome b6-f complex iron-sulfur subunit